MRRAASSGPVPYVYANVTACFDYYSDYYSPQGNGLVFVKNESIQDPPSDSLLLWVSVIPRTDDWGKNLWALGNGSFPTAARVSQPETAVTRWYIGKPHYEVDYCLLQRAPWYERRCRLQYSPWILWLVCLANLSKLMVIFTIWWANKIRARRAKDVDGVPSPASRKEDRLDTLGDAIQSFMSDPDSTTKSMCLPTWRELQRPPDPPWGRWTGRGSEESRPYEKPREHEGVEHRWRHSTGRQQWALFIFT